MTYRRLPEHPTQQDIADLAQDIVGGLVVTTDHFAETGDAGTGRMVFMPIAMGALDGYRKEQLAKLIGFAVEGRDTTFGGIAVNGYHMFATCRIWRRSDYAKAQELACRAYEVLHPGKAAR